MMVKHRDGYYIESKEGKRIVIKWKYRDPSYSLIKGFVEKWGEFHWWRMELQRGSMSGGTIWVETYIYDENLLNLVTKNKDNWGILSIDVDSDFTPFDVV